MISDIGRFRLSLSDKWRSCWMIYDNERLCGLYLTIKGPADITRPCWTTSGNGRSCWKISDIGSFCEIKNLPDDNWLERFCWMILESKVLLNNTSNVQILNFFQHKRKEFVLLMIFCFWLLLLFHQVVSSLLSTRFLRNEFNSYLCYTL